MRNVVILGTGGCAAELTFYIEDTNQQPDVEEKIKILGYIDYPDSRDKHYNKYNFPSPYLCDIDSYIPNAGEEVLLAVANIEFRRKIIAKLQDKNATIGSFIHYSSIVSRELKLGEGNIIFPFCIIENYADVGSYNLLTSYSFISHDCQVGDNNFFSTAGIAGSVDVGSDNYFGIRATVIPGVTIGNRNVIQAGMIVDKNVKDNTTVFYRYKEQVLAIPKVV